MTAQERAEKIFANCFREAELTFLKKQPEFVEASRKIETLNDTLKVVELGERLIKETWNSGGQADSKFTPKKL